MAIRPDRPPTIDELEGALSTFRGLRQQLQLRLVSVEQSIELLEHLCGEAGRATKKVVSRKKTTARRRGKKGAKKRRIVAEPLERTERRKPIADAAKVRRATKAMAKTKPPKLSGEPGNASDRIRLVLASAPASGYSIDDVMGACGKKVERQLAMATLSRLVTAGELERVSRGHYRLARTAA